MTDYKKAWEDCAKYAHRLELELNETDQAFANECATTVYWQEEAKQLKIKFEAELNAAKNDYEHIKQLKAENARLARLLQPYRLYGELNAAIGHAIRDFNKATKRKFTHYNALIEQARENSLADTEEKR